MTALLATHNLVKRFGGLIAANNVDFAVEAGETRGLIGPNGAGKTTLVNLITGIHAPTSGEITLAGESLVGLTPHRITRLGLVRSFQVSRLFGNLSVADNLMLPHLASQGAAGMAGGREMAR
ncbi:MAG TPA: ATP-binding cassette domain-containing protein, partial [Candidatus Cybelea sp.]|nr:ATP-binding cassette domain-containing protein [Candidatus Cybelea sp.]